MNPEEPLWALQRCRMVQDHLADRGIHDRRVLAVMGELPRERFIGPVNRHMAYADGGLPIGHAQTISQPYIVALMTQELNVLPHHRVLDIGAGSGYQTAVLARLAAHVYAVERIAELAEGCRAVLAELGIANVSLTCGDGTLGWPEHAPYDRILCGAAGPDAPAAWLDQLADDGRIVAPIGPDDRQVLVAIHKRSGCVSRREICPVRFVRLIGQHGWPQGDSDLWERV
jgi:protein-L-isoaspartate(D-aspartate) O-methyltransferase